MEKLYWTIGEVAEMLGESVPLVRSWADGFPELVRPARNAKGNRLFTASDVEALRQIHFLVRVKGMTLKAPRSSWRPTGRRRRGASRCWSVSKTSAAVSKKSKKIPNFAVRIFRMRYCAE